MDRFSLLYCRVLPAVLLVQDAVLSVRDKVLLIRDAILLVQSGMQYGPGVLVCISTGSIVGKGVM
jgi:N-acetylglucosamine kinase-like BadF-type ATPase